MVSNILYRIASLIMVDSEPLRTGYPLSSDAGKAPH